MSRSLGHRGPANQATSVAVRLTCVSTFLVSRSFRATWRRLSRTPDCEDLKLTTPKLSQLPTAYGLTMPLANSKLACSPWPVSTAKDITTEDVYNYHMTRDYDYVALYDLDSGFRLG